MTTNNFLRRTTAAAVAAVSAVALAAPGATAAASAPNVFALTGEALALELSVTAPAGLLSPAIGSDSLLQKISFTNTSLNSDGVVAAAANLLEGTLGNVGISSADGGTGNEATVPPQDLAGLIQIGAGTTSYIADAAQNLSKAFSELAYLRGSIAPLFDGSTLPAEVTEPVQGAVGTVTDTVNGIVGDLNGTLDEVEALIRETVGETVALPNVDVPAIPDVTRLDLFEINKIWSESVLDTIDGAARSTVNAGIINASLLGGLVEVPAFQYTSWAQAAGTPGSADAGTEVTTIAVRIAGSDVVKVAGDQISVGTTVVDLSDLNIAGEEAGAILDTLTGELTSLLNTAGVSFAQGEGVTQVAPDGTSASAATSAFSLNVAPLHAAGMDDILNVSLKLLPTKAAASATVAPAEAPAPAPAPDEPPAMPRTGGGAVAMILGTLAMGGAGFLRRKF